MRVLYYTNSDVTDENIIPDIIKKLTGDNVIICKKKLTIEFIKKNRIEFIVSDRSRALITKDIINLFPKKIINLHPSFLPWNRGYHPNYWSAKENTPYGVTIHYIDEGIDTGMIIAQTEFSISQENDTLKLSYDRLRKLMISLFENCWIDIRNLNVGKKNQKGRGTIHLKNDFKGEFSRLKLGWDTKLKDI
jgi:methionyl-tRNA formyltransferase